jgi:hypothetical protein
VWTLWRREKSCTASVIVCAEEQQTAHFLQHYCLFSIDSSNSPLTLGGIIVVLSELSIFHI